MTIIASVKAQQLLDAKGRPVVEVTVVTQDGAKGTTAAPTGSTVGGHEPHVLRDGGER